MKMQNRIKNYFQEEKQESLFFLGVATLATILGLLGIFYFDNPMWLGIAIPLLGIALIQVIVGLSFFVQTNRQVPSLLLLFEKNPTQFFKEEIPRMEKVNANFKVYRNIEMLIFLLGFFFAVVGTAFRWGDFVIGTGIGLLIQSSIMLCLDLFGEFRANLYTHKLYAYKEKRGL